MKDLKLKKKISGLGGADCLLCKSKQKDWTNQETILNKESFRIDRSATDTRSILNSVIDGDGNIRTKPHDFDIRSGVTHEPITVYDQHSIIITHSYINVCSWFLKLFYHCFMNLEDWSDKKENNESLQLAKRDVRDAI